MKRKIDQINDDNIENNYYLNELNNILIKFISDNVFCMVRPV